MLIANWLASYVFFDCLIIRLHVLNTTLILDRGTYVGNNSLNLLISQMTKKVDRITRLTINFKVYPVNLVHSCIND